MNRAKINYVIDLLLVVCLIVVGVTGLVLALSFSSDIPQAGKIVGIFGTYKHDWSEVHTLFGMWMLGFMLAHLVLHFNWLKIMTKGLVKKKKN